MLGFWACLFVLILSLLNQSLTQDLRAQTRRDKLLFHLMPRFVPLDLGRFFEHTISLLSSSSKTTGF
ncbi:hypothetical protein TorRG33x02_181900 [Trema orientale]|uniref:Uncharacterized protein n=1 Tax=Trema orientale TaxID=63057 RepID=A0A2P5EKE9_TREOI|nr:hypothetical protein TorRG33x02_181900 [Trema orientale]